MPNDDLPPDLDRESEAVLRARIAHAKRVHDFDRRLAERLYKSLGYLSSVHSPLGRKTISGLEAFVSTKVNEHLKSIIVAKDDLPGNEGRGRTSGRSHLISTDPADPFYELVQRLVRTAFPPTNGVHDAPFVRRRVTRCLIALRTFQKAAEPPTP